MTLLDTHIWIWYVNQSERLTAVHRQMLAARKADRLGVSVISCWEVAKLVERGRLELDRPIEEWVSQALAKPEIELIALTPEIAIASTQLPGEFHRDPADQIIVATAREYNIEVFTVDRKVLNYKHVRTVRNA